MPVLKALLFFISHIKVSVVLGRHRNLETLLCEEKIQKRSLGVNRNLRNVDRTRNLRTSACFLAACPHIEVSLCTLYDVPLLSKVREPA